MPERYITELQELMIDSYLRDKRNLGVDVILDSKDEGPMLYDNYTVGNGYVNLITNIEDRSKPSKVECDDETAKELQRRGIDFPKESQLDAQTT